MRQDVEAKFLEFARRHAVGGLPEQAARVGHYSAMAGAEKPDLFGSLDILHALFILDLLDEVTDDAGRGAWIEHLLTYQGEDGWFRANDRQVHAVEHATAYALGGLQILTANDGERIADRLRPLRGLQAEIAAMPGPRVPPFALSLLHRVHFWRGSHRAAGIAAAVGAVRELGLAGEHYVGIADPAAWLDGWWRYFAPRIAPESGYWSLAPEPVRRAFNLLYRFRHDPALATMGGAVHLYWIAEKIAAPIPHPAALAASTAALLRETGLYENEPYCIDLDGSFCIARALPQLDAAAHERGRAALAANRAAVLGWFAERRPADWNPNSHNLPGAFAAVAEVDRVMPPADGRAWRDVFERTWWL